MGKAKRARKAKYKATEKRTSARADVGGHGIAFYLVCVGLLAVTLAVYWQITQFPLTDVDDPVYLSDNTVVRSGLTGEGIKWAFGIGRVANWHPLTWMSHMLDVQIFGMAPAVLRGTGGHHLTSLLFHILNSLLLFLVLNRMTGFMWRSAFVAALFALHPLHVESVAWVAERKDVLSTFFMMLTLWAYACYVERPSIGRYVLIVISFALGLMSKQMLVSLPILLLLLDYWPLNRASSRNAVKKMALEKIPLFLMSAAAGIIIVVAQRTGGAMTSSIAFGSRATNAIVTYVVYILDMCWPSGLAHYYPYEDAQWTLWQIAGSVVLIVGMSYISIKAVRSFPAVLVGWSWYLVSLLPVIGLVQVGGQARADRYTYIALIGIFIVIAYTVPELIERMVNKKHTIPLAVMSGFVITAMIPATYRQIGYWSDNEMLYRHTLSVTKNNWFVHSALAAILYRQADALRAGGKPEEARETCLKAVEHARQAIRIAPGMTDAHNILANILAALAARETREAERTALLEEAESEYKKALILRPNDAFTHNNLANLYLGRNEFGLAIQHYQAALQSDQSLAATHCNLAIALERNGQKEEAIGHYRKALELYPSDFVAYWASTQIAGLIGGRGQRSEAISLLKQAVQINEKAQVDPVQNTAQHLLEALTKS